LWATNWRLMMSNVFFTSDLHFGHDNLLEFRREVHNNAFPSYIEDMNQWLIEKWNSRVRPRDTVWVLGDVAWGDENLHYLAQCNGTKNLILGNHDLERGDSKLANYQREFEYIGGVKKKYKFVMSHCPIHPLELEHRNWTNNVHGHIHHFDRCLPEPTYINVNVDVNKGLPLSLDEIRKKIGD